MVVGIVAYILEVVVFTARADAFLGISGTRRIVGCLLGAEEIGHKLIHPRVREKQVGGSRHKGRRGHRGVRFGFKKIEKGLADLSGGHGRGLLNIEHRTSKVAP